MPQIASSTGLIATRTRPARQPKAKKLELQASSIPAPFILRPFAGLFNPYPYSCSVLCNHPADSEVKKVVRCAKSMWACEDKALQLPVGVHLEKPLRDSVPPEGVTVPEELFRINTEMDSRSDSLKHLVHKDPFRENKDRPSLVLDLRATFDDVQESKTLNWHALSLEPASRSQRRDFLELARNKRHKLSLLWHHRVTTIMASSAVRSISIPKMSETLKTNMVLSFEDEKDNEKESLKVEEEALVRRKGKLRRKKRRRGSIYGQQTEVREPPEPLETQVSQIVITGSRLESYSNLEEIKTMPLDKIILPTIKDEIQSSFLSPDIIKELSKELDQEMIEWEFNSNRRFALEEVLRIMSDYHLIFRGPRQDLVQSHLQNIPRLFYRRSARFELLDSQTLIGLKPLDYLSRHVYVNDLRKIIFGRTFNKYSEETVTGPRYLLGKRIFHALHDVMGRALFNDDVDFLECSLGNIQDQLDFRTWCGLCAFAERSLPALLPRDEDPPSWLERADFEMLGRRLSRVQIDEKLALMLLLIRNR